MEKEKAEVLVREVFEKLINSKSMKDLLDLLNSEEISKYRLDIKKYPKINFNVSVAEINKLLDIGYIKESKLNINAIDFNKESALTKLLYSILWKNGDLGKEKHLISGIKGDDKDDHKGLVFYQFGKYLADDSKNEPIIDQHTLRAFGVYMCTTYKIKVVEDSLEKKNTKKVLDTQYYLNLEATSYREIPLINEYKIWIETHHLYPETDFVYYLDLIMFALGKSIKN